MKKRTRIILACGFVSLGLVIAYFLFAGLVMHRGASDTLRVGPLAEQLMPETRPVDPRELGYRGDPREAFGLPFETVSIDGELGPAKTWYVPGGRAESDLVAIYIHGVAGGREDGYRHLELLHGAGISTALISYRNDEAAPASPDGHYAFGLTEWRDLESAVIAMRARGYERVVLVGDSMGGAIVGQFLRRSVQAEHVAGIALDAPALDFRAILAFIGGRAGAVFPHLVTEVAMAMFRLEGPVDLSQADVRAEIVGFDGPLFIAHGTGDTVVPVSITDRIVIRRQGMTFLLRSSGDHLLSYIEDPERYARVFDGFLGALD
ncbi:hypothetical protein [Saliniramus sp.]|uniref:alpha/beta hydrolase family protein n=1 Tax=Saliniramus sp. TaxID=2986772 RepID=UPI002C567CE1|nr:hypothetical protein [Saliniramus sp.]HMB11582.1 hypothetical protein [Saliniramus sp.]